MKPNNPFINTRIEFHILQAFPVTCLNRDDVGAPKTAVIGGTTRARVSSQCWKRQVRLLMGQLGIKLSNRTKLISKLIAEGCIEAGATEEQAQKCGNTISEIFGLSPKKKNNKSKSEEQDEEEAEASKNNDTLIFLSPIEVSNIVEVLHKKNFEPDLVFTDKDKSKTLQKIMGSDLKKSDALDIALFGRMVAKAATMNIEAAASFSHAISTHKITNEVEFFTAMDDQQEEIGSAHMGSLEFNSATYYRYVCLDLGQLWQTLKGQNFGDALEVFTKALFLAVPPARQTTQSGASPWEFAKIFIRKGQRLQVPFETAVKSKNQGFLESSIEQLKQYLAKKEKLGGSLFGKIEEITFGEDENISIDHIIQKLKNFVNEGYHG